MVLSVSILDSTYKPFCSHPSKRIVFCLGRLRCTISVNAYCRLGIYPDICYFCYYFRTRIHKKWKRMNNRWHRTYNRDLQFTNIVLQNLIRNDNTPQTVHFCWFHEITMMRIFPELQYPFLDLCGEFIPSKHWNRNMMLAL